KVVLVTGAGASTCLGPDGKGPPLMDGWAANLSDRPEMHSELIGIRKGMPGLAFEERIGAFLHFRESLPNVSPYHRAGLPSPTDPSTAIETWFAQASGVADQINETLLKSLHELFGEASIHPTVAASAYGPLLTALQATELTYATTNYDLAGEIA